MSLTSKIIYGTAWKKEQTTALVVTAVLNGFKAIDTAGQPKHYREDLVGKALLQLQEEHGISRESLFVQTKFTSISGQDITKPIPYDQRESIPEQIRTSLHNSLSNLHTTYIDSYLLHSPMRTLEQTIEAWKSLAALQDEGKIRMIGVSNTYDVHILASLERVRKVQVVQNRWYEGNGWDRPVLNYCKEHGIVYQSFWTLSGSPSLLSHPDLIAIAQELNCTPAQAVYRIAQLEGITPLSGTTNEDHMRQDVAVEELSLDQSSITHQLASLQKFIQE
ncbi:Aldo/keto reductase [Cyathus striatus]|nr:Aldo/keto reductase [Cyathus striatus]